MKECIPEADTGKSRFRYSKNVKEQVMKKYKYDPTDSGRGDIGLVCSALLFFSNNTRVLVCLTCIVALHLS